MLQAGWRLEVRHSVSWHTHNPGMGASVVDAAPGPSMHPLPTALSLELVPFLTCLLSDILQLCSSSPAVQLVTTAKPWDETSTDCLAIVTAYMLLYTVPAWGRLTNASPSPGVTLWETLLQEGWGRFGTKRKTSICQNVLLKNLTSSYSPWSLCPCQYCWPLFSLLPYITVVCSSSLAGSGL